jgi:hypothetical protein
MSGASASPTIARPAPKTSTPETAERPASSRIDETITGVAASVPAFLSQKTRAAGVQIPPGMYFASIDAISDWSATEYETRTDNARRIHCQPTTKSR